MCLTMIGVIFNLTRLQHYFKILLSTLTDCSGFLLMKKFKWFLHKLAILRFYIVHRQSIHILSGSLLETTIGVNLRTSSHTNSATFYQVMKILKRTPIIGFTKHSANLHLHLPLGVWPKDGVLIPRSGIAPIMHQH